MSEETKVDQVNQVDQNIDNQIGDTVDKKDTNDMIPRAVLIRERKKLQDRLHALEPAAALAEEIAKAGNTDLNGLRTELETVKSKRPAPPPVPVANSKLEERLSRLEQNQTKNITEQELDTFISDNPTFDMTAEMKDDVKAYAAEKKIPVSEAAWAKYGSKFSSNARKIEETAQRNDAAMSTALGGSGGMTIDPGEAKKYNLTPNQIRAASAAKMSAQEFAIYLEGDRTVIADIYKKK